MKEVTEEIKEKIHGLCRDYLGGSWTNVEQADLNITTVPDGNVNKLYFCDLPDHMDDQHKKLVVRLTTNLEDVKELRNHTHVIAMNVILSEKAISPKLLAVFEDGMIHKKIDNCRYFMNNDDRIDTRVQKLATKLADFHSLRMPLPKARNPLWDTMLEPDNPFYKNLIMTYNIGLVRQLIEELDCKTHKDLNVFDEIQCLNAIIADLNSPIVFSHNDFNRKNILISRSKDSDEDEIYIIDFDWTNHNYRGADLGRYFCNYAQSEPEFGCGDFPSDQEMSVFLNAYIKRMTEIFGESYAKHEINSSDQLIKESKIFAMYAMLVENFYFMYLTSSEPNNIDKNKKFMRIAEMRYGLYVTLKNKVLQEYADIKENTIANEKMKRYKQCRKWGPVIDV